MKSIRVQTPSKPRARPKTEKLNVVARVRPMTKSEQSRGTPRIVDINEHTSEIQVNGKREQRKFGFSKVYGPKATQDKIFQDCVSQAIDDVCLGFSCTLFAYGQTGTGKTYTMEGSRDLDDTIGSTNIGLHGGIIPRSIWHLFERLEKQGANFTIKVSLLEIYNEKLIDLLAETASSSLERDAEALKIYENPETGVPYVGNLTEIDVTTRAQVFEILAQGSKRRTTAATEMNAQSSRSHCIFQAVVNLQQPDSEIMVTGRLYLVDLAGSENIQRSGAGGLRAKEAGNINKSLLTLGRVINLLVERKDNKKKGHIPYRDSQLTRLLQNALGGKSKTTMIITLSPAKTDYDETMSSLEYGRRAQNIKNNPEVTESKNLTRHVEHLNDEIRKLRNMLDLQSAKTGGIVISLERQQELESKEEAYAQIFEEKMQLEKDNVEASENLRRSIEERERMEQLVAEYEEEVCLLKFISSGALRTSQKQFDQAGTFKSSGESILAVLATSKKHLVTYNQVCSWNDKESTAATEALKACATQLESLITDVERETEQSVSSITQHSASQKSQITDLQNANAQFSEVFQTCLTELKSQNSQMSDQTMQYVKTAQEQLDSHSTRLQHTQKATDATIQKLTSQIGENLSTISSSYQNYYTKHSSLISTRLEQILNDDTLESQFHRTSNEHVKARTDALAKSAAEFLTQQASSVEAHHKQYAGFVEERKNSLDNFLSSAKKRRAEYDTTDQTRTQEYHKKANVQETERVEMSQQFARGMHKKLQDAMQTMLTQFQDEMQQYVSAESEKVGAIRGETNDYLKLKLDAQTQFHDNLNTARSTLCDSVYSEDTSQFEKVQNSTNEFLNSTKNFGGSVTSGQKDLSSWLTTHSVKKITAHKASKSARETSVEEAREACNSYVEKLKERVQSLEEGKKSVSEQSTTYGNLLGVELKAAAAESQKLCGDFTTKFHSISALRDTATQRVITDQAKTSTSITSIASTQSSNLESVTYSLQERLSALKKLSSSQRAQQTEIVNEVNEFQTTRKTNPKLSVPPSDSDIDVFKSEVVATTSEAKLTEEYVIGKREKEEAERSMREREEEEKRMQEEEKENEGLVDDDQFLVPMKEGGYFGQENGSRTVSSSSKRKKFKKPVLTPSISNDQLDKIEVASVTSSEVSPRQKKGRVGSVEE